MELALRNALFPNCQRELSIADGSTVAADVIMCNTGFKRDYSCLKKLGLDLSSTRDLFKRMIPAEHGATLVFVGWARPAEGGVPALAEMQARYQSMLLAADCRLPKDCVEQTQFDKASDCARYFLSPTLDAQVHYPKLMEELAELIGCKPNMFRLFFTDNTLWRRLWFGSHQACSYRLSGPDAQRALALETINRLPVAWFTNQLSSKVAMKLFAMNIVSFVCTPFGVFEASW